MAESIYNVFLMKYTEAWYQLEDEEKDRIFKKIGDSFEEVGAEQIIICDSSWSAEAWQSFGLIKFPNIEALQKHRQDTNNLDWPRYVEAMSVLGTEWQP